MPVIRPFAAYRFNRELGLDYSNLIAPPYDVIDEARREELRGKSDYNIVRVDVPHLPAKSVGPDEAYAGSDRALRQWVADGIVTQDRRAAFYPYEQTYEALGRTFHRRGFFTLVKLSPFGSGLGADVVPHERTYKGPIEDRLKLMRATGMQMSPVFGLYNDPRNEVTGALFAGVSRPDLSATLDGVKNDLWTVFDAAIETTVIDLMKGRSVYIADGHHRYTTALQYQFETEQAFAAGGVGVPGAAGVGGGGGGGGVGGAGGPLPPAHPANYCLFSLVSMQDDGLQILPTHRLIQDMPAFDLDRFIKAVSEYFTVVETSHAADEALLLHVPQHGFGLFDGVTKKLYLLSPRGGDPLAATHAEQSEVWRKLDVAVLQHYLIEQVLQPMFGAGRELARSYSAEVAAAVGQTDGVKHRIAILLRPTPLSALVELGKTGEVMPQKSTYFFPKIATGLVMASLK